MLGYDSFTDSKNIFSLGLKKMKTLIASILIVYNWFGIEKNVLMCIFNI